MDKAFTGIRYATRGIADGLGVELQAGLWALIDEQKKCGRHLDYLQVFELSIECAFGEMFQKVIHSQEQPPFSQTLYYRNMDKPFAGKVWVIDSGEYATMLFPAEY